MNKSLPIFGGIVAILIAGVLVLLLSNSNNNQTSKVAGTVTERCIVTVDGSKYDLTEFRYVHGGGNIFICGSDMTARFNGHHGLDYARLAPYKVS